MHNNNLLKRLLAVTAVAAMFSAFGVHAQQTTGSSSTGSTSASGQATTQTGKTTSEGTVGNTESRGKDEKTNGMQGATQGTSGSQGTTGSQGMSGVSDTTGAGASSGMTGKTTSEGTVGNTNSTGMEKRQGKDQGMSGSHGTSKDQGMSGSSGTSGSQGMSGGGTAAAGKSSLDKADEKMLKAMAQANIAEIEAGKLAQSKSQNDQVKSFAQQMIDDHTKALGDVQAVAQQKGVTLPTEPDAKHKAMATKLESLSGDAFDKEYMAKAGVSDHKAVHSALMRDEKKAKDADVKALASKMAPVVEQHLKSAEQMKSAKSGTTSGK